MILEEFKERWWRRIKENGLENAMVTLTRLNPEEAVGKPVHAEEFALIKGREVMVQAEVEGFSGQAFTDDPPTQYKGDMKSIYDITLDTNKGRSILVATANATYKYLGLVTNTVHCRDVGPSACAERIAQHLASTLPPEGKLLMIGFQPAIANQLSKKFKNFRVTDMDPFNVGQVKGGVMIESYEVNREAINWSDAILATGSTLVNGSIEEIVRLSRGKKLIFYGVTIASAAYELALPRLCFSSF